MSHTFARASAAVALLASLGACAGRNLGVPVEPDPSQSLAVEVRNEAFSDIVVYAMNADSRWRLGMVPGNHTVTLEIPRHLVPVAGPLELIADPIGGSAYRLSAASVSLGQWVQLTLRESPSTSEVAVWTR